MEIIEQKINAVTVVQLKGRLDILSAKDMEERSLNIVEKEKAILFDCRDLEFICSSGLRLLLILLKKGREEKALIAFCRIQDNVREVLEVSGFMKMLSAFQSPEEGLKHLENQMKTNTA